MNSRILFFVMPGLDPGIQQKIRLVLISDELPGQARQ
jgi:hypothetical protein